MAGKELRLCLCTFITFLCCFSFSLSSSDFAIARVKYRGGDWDEGPSTLPNFLTFLRKNTSLKVSPKEHRVSLASPDLFRYPFVFLTGHGNIIFNKKEIANLRRYLIQGGFLYIDDDFGLDKAVRRLLKATFPEKKLLLLPSHHPLYRAYYFFSEGCPKIHEHYPGPPRVYALFHKGRLMVLYTFNTNISDGWESPEVHGDPPEKRKAAFKMGTNILFYALFQ